MQPASRFLFENFFVTHPFMIFTQRNIAKEAIGFERQRWERVKLFVTIPNSITTSSWFVAVLVPYYCPSHDMYLYYVYIFFHLPSQDLKRYTLKSQADL